MSESSTPNPASTSDPGSARQLETRDRLIFAAVSLFARKGYEGTSVKEVAEGAGVNISLISYHFGGKEGLYRACLEKFGEERVSVAQRILQPGQSVTEFKVRLRMFIEEVIHRQMEEPEINIIIQRDLDLELPIALDVFKKTFVRGFQTLHQFFADAQSRGLVSSVLDPEICAAILFSSICHLTRMDNIHNKLFGRSLKDPVMKKQFIDHLLELALVGALNRATPGALL